MISKLQLPELAIFEKIERRFPVVEQLERGVLVVPNNNDQLPVHQWFKYKEAFSARLLRVALEKIIPNLGRDITVLDPFCGVGTTLVSAQDMSESGYRINAIGIECNPFAAFVAKTKTKWPQIAPDELEKIGQIAWESSKKIHVELPELSSIHEGRCLSKQRSRRIIAIRSAIQNLGDSPTHDALLLGLAAIIEPVSNIRRDGRALRLVKKDEVSFKKILMRQWEMMASDVAQLRASLAVPGTPLVFYGDGRVPGDVGIHANSIDLILTSPPYPNNIDYNEVYKLELWLLGFANSASEFLALRKKSFRSHPTCKELEATKDFADALKRGPLHDLIRPLLSKIQDLKENHRKRVLLGYCSDLWVSLKELLRCLKKSRYAIFVVGNSLHGGMHDPYLIPTDLIVATIGRLVGFEVERLIIARSLRRRLPGNHYLRESIVVLKKI